MTNKMTIYKPAAIKRVNDSISWSIKENKKARECYVTLCYVMLWLIIMLLSVSLILYSYINL